MKIIARDIPPRAAWALEQAGIHPLLARLYAARGVQGKDELDDGLARLLPPAGMKGLADAAVLLADAIAADRKLCIVADYDCDGATACAVAMRGLRLLGAKHVDYLVPDRVVDGYGLTSPIAQRVKDQGADVLITVDNGIASVDGVATANALGLQVLVTDHHLPGPTLPQADVIVNPNQPGCEFESKSIAGVGVMFYVLLALRAELRQRGVFVRGPTQAGRPAAAGRARHGGRRGQARRQQPPPGRAGPEARARRRPSLRAGRLFTAAGRKATAATTFDFGFALGPRINAAGRLADMTLGIECLLTDDAGARRRAGALAGWHQPRTPRDRGRHARPGHADRRDAVRARARSRRRPSACSTPDFHEGVVGIVASRIKDKLHRPTFVFAASGAPGKEHELKGSGRSIAGFHLRDALDLVAKRHPGVLLRFGGHAMAAGCTVPRTSSTCSNRR